MSLVILYITLCKKKRKKEKNERHPVIERERQNIQFVVVRHRNKNIYINRNTSKARCFI